MQRGFWGKLKKPILALAPMADVTDFAYRELFAKLGKPDVMWTEFVSCDGLANSQGRKALVKNLRFSQIQRPIVAQLFGSNPDTFFTAAQLIRKLGFDGIDINMGCPEKSICQAGSGAALFNQPALAQEIVAQTKRGAGELPVSVKIRTGYTQADLEPWINTLIKAKPVAIIVHARTKREMSKVPADWAMLGRVVKKLRKKYSTRQLPLILGNGDVQTVVEAEAKAKQYALDGVMVGRATFGNPWFFQPKPISQRELFCTLVIHAKLYEKTTGRFKPFDLMKKHFKAYISGFKGAKELRLKLMQTVSAQDVERLLKAHLL
ncbi:MAG: tRNA-dihydrouridine synthase [Patescibacteria group bacterium]|nr:tRNA-dihydrouridine synthase [Patescibacteria group bacterium]